MHYVPRTYLKHFGTTKGKNSFVHRIPVLNPAESEIREVDIKTICVEPNLYSMPGKTADERMLVEDLYSEIFEKKYDRIYKILIDPSVNEISEEDRALVISTVTSMYFRNNAWNIFINDFTSRIIESGYLKSKDLNKESFFINNEEIKIKDKTLEQIQEDYIKAGKATFNVTQFNQALKLLQIRQAGDVIMVMKLKDTDFEYVVGDHPVICYKGNEKIIAPIDPANTITMPLDGKHRLILRPLVEEESNKFQIYRIPGRSLLAKGDFILANFLQASSTSKSILGSKNGILQYIKHKQYFERLS